MFVDYTCTVPSPQSSNFQGFGSPLRSFSCQGPNLQQHRRGNPFEAWRLGPDDQDEGRVGLGVFPTCKIKGYSMIFWYSDSASNFDWHWNSIMWMGVDRCRYVAMAICTLWIPILGTTDHWSSKHPFCFGHPRDLYTKQKHLKFGEPGGRTADITLSHPYKSRLETAP